MIQQLFILFQFCQEVTVKLYCALEVIRPTLHLHIFTIIVMNLVD